MKIRLAGIVNDSVVDGPGIRVAVFAQGCPHACPGCHNPHTHDPREGMEMDTEDVMAEIRRARYIGGVTFTGGEPFLQAEAFIELARKVKSSKLHLVIYSGYVFEELLALGKTNAHYLNLLSYADLLVDGPYIQEKRDLSLAFRGSRNQRIVNVKDSLACGRAIEAMD